MRMSWTLLQAVYYNQLLLVLISISKGCFSIRVFDYSGT